MKFLKLYLKSYGHFYEQGLNFSDQSKGFHIIYGPNEAGKSTVLCSLSDLLFGFNQTTEYAFKYKSETLRIGAELQSNDLKQLYFFRRKGRTKTILDRENQPLDEDCLKPFIGPLERKTFEGLFGLNHERLRAGGKDILEGKGDIGISLFEASAGVLGLKNLLQSLNKESRILFLPNGQNQEINISLKQYIELKKKARDLILSGDTYRSLDKELREESFKRQAILTSIQEKQTEKVKLERIKRNLPSIAIQNSLLDKLNQLMDVPELPNDASERRQKAQNVKHTSKEMIDHYDQEVKRIEEKISNYTIEKELIPYEDQISNLYNQGAVINKHQNDLPKRYAELSQLEKQISNITNQLGQITQINELRSKMPSPALITSIRELIKNDVILKTKLNNNQASSIEVEGEYNQALQELHILGEEINVSTLEALIEQINSEGNLKEFLEGSQRKMLTLEEAYHCNLKSLRLWSGPTEELISLPLPSLETIESYEKRENEVNQKITQSNQYIKDVKDELAHFEEELSNLTIQGEIPTLELLSSSRNSRNYHWELIKKIFVLQDKDTPILPESTDLGDLPEVYETKVSYADELSDQLYKESSQVNKFVSLSQSRERASQRLQKREEELKQLESQLKQIYDEWEQLWEPLGLKHALSPIEMKSWLNQHQTICSQFLQISEMSRDIDSSKNRIEAYRKQLFLEIENHTLEAIDEQESLEKLIYKGRALIKSASDRTNKRVQLTGKVSDSQKSIDVSTKRRKLLQEGIDDWRISWFSSLKKLGKPEDTQPIEMEGILDQYSKLDLELTKWEDLYENRILRMESDSESFTQMVSVLLATLAIDTVKRTPIEASKILSERLNHTKEQLKLKDKDEEDLELYSKKLEQEKINLRNASIELELLCKQAGCELADDLEKIEKLSLEKKSYREELQKTEKWLLSSSEGLSLEQIVNEAIDVDNDGLEGRIESLTQEINFNSDKSRELSSTIGSLENELARMDGSDASATALQESQEILSLIQDSTENFLRLKLGEVLLCKAIEQYRTKNQEPILMRTGQIFCQLTDGAFNGLHEDYDKNDNPTLRGVRSNDEGVTVEGMSEGTRDQLFLALRLAVIEQYNERNEKLPFIVDDILINFDDERAKAALAALNELSKKTQVLFFTHHKHLLDLAKEALPITDFSIHMMLDFKDTLLATTSTI